MNISEFIYISKDKPSLISRQVKYLSLHFDNFDVG